MSEKILITGGAGFIGSNLALGLINKGYNVSVIDCFHTTVSLPVCGSFFPAIF